MHTLGHLVTKFMINYSIKLLSFLIEIMPFHRKFHIFIHTNLSKIIFIKKQIILKQKFLFNYYFIV